MFETITLHDFHLKRTQHQHNTAQILINLIWRRPGHWGSMANIGASGTKVVQNIFLALFTLKLCSKYDLNLILAILTRLFTKAGISGNFFNGAASGNMDFRNLHKVSVGVFQLLL